MEIEKRKLRKNLDKDLRPTLQTEIVKEPSKPVDNCNIGDLFLNIYSERFLLKNPNESSF